MKADNRIFSSEEFEFAKNFFNGRLIEEFNYSSGEAVQFIITNVEKKDDEKILLRFSCYSLKDNKIMTRWFFKSQLIAIIDNKHSLLKII